MKLFNLIADTKEYKTNHRYNECVRVGRDLHTGCAIRYKDTLRFFKTYTFNLNKLIEV